jgi:plastocyanin
LRLQVNRYVLGLGAVAAAIAVAGCGPDEEPDLVNGKALFIGKGTCGSCHALARANTKATRGPSLDDAFRAAKAAGMTKETVQGVVYDQIGNVRRGSIMPEGLVKGQDARDVAAYVAFAAANPGKDTGLLVSAGAPKPSSKPVVAKGGKAEIDAAPTGALAYLATKAEAEAGPLELISKNESPVPHNIAVKGSGIDEKGPVVKGGGTSKVSASVKPGKYTFYCSVPGHEEGGMKGELTVK